MKCVDGKNLGSDGIVLMTDKEDDGPILVEELDLVLPNILDLNTTDDLAISKSWVAYNCGTLGISIGGVELSP